MEILQVIYSLTSGGGERFVVNLCNEMVNAGHHVTLLTIRDPSINGWGFNRQFLLDKVLFESLCIPPGARIQGILRAWRYMKRKQFDVVNFHLSVVPFFVLCFIFNRKTCYFHTLHNIANYALPQHGRFVYLFLYKMKIVFPIAISPFCAASLSQLYPCIKRIKTINNGTFAPIPSSNYKKVLNEIVSYKLSSETKVLLHVARFAKQKRQDILFQAIDELAKEGKDIILCVIGEGYDSDEARALLKTFNRNIFVLGLKNNPGDYMYASDVFCLSSAYEGLPISLLEAISCGCIPICTPVGGILNVITDEKTGYLASDVSVQGMKDAINRYLACPQRINRNVLKEYFERNFTMKKCSNDYLDYYQQRLTSATHTKSN